MENCSSGVTTWFTKSFPTTSTTDSRAANAPWKRTSLLKQTHQSFTKPGGEWKENPHCFRMDTAAIKHPHSNLLRPPPCFRAGVFFPLRCSFIYLKPSSHAVSHLSISKSNKARTDFFSPSKLEGKQVSSFHLSLQDRIFAEENVSFNLLDRQYI